MIEKLGKQSEGDMDWEYSNRKMGDKINELIDFLNDFKIAELTINGETKKVVIIK